MNYSNSFIKRAASFLSAVNSYSYCLNNEFKTAVKHLNPKFNDNIVNLGAGGIILDKYMSNINYMPLEFSKEFSKLTNTPLCSIDKFPFQNNSIDKFIILALLHHFSESERIKLYNECFRCLKPGGKLIVADVIKNSAQDYWLNTFVNKYNPCGHNGEFFKLDDKNLLIKSKFIVETKIENYNWEFKSYSDFIEFNKKLFYLNINDKTLIKNAKKYLNLKFNNNLYTYDWKLIYFSAFKPIFVPVKPLSHL